MKISEVFQGVQRLYVETAPLIYYVEENPSYVALMDSILKIAANGPIELVSSVMTITEVLIHPLKLKNPQLAQEYRNILTNTDDFRLLNITSTIAETAAQLRVQYNLV